MQTSISSRGILLLSARLSLLLVVCLATSLILTPISPTAANTPARLVKDIDTRPQSRTYGNPHDFTAVGSTIYFAAADKTNGEELWKTDGTTAGTVLVRDIAPLMVGAGAGSFLNSFVGFKEYLFFAANAAGEGQNYLWKSDGTAAGTVPATDLGPRMQEPGVQPFTVLNDSLLLFVSSQNSNVTELWTTDGTPGSAQKVKDIGIINALGPDTFTGKRFFVASNQQFGEELWVTDGTPPGTKEVKDILPGSGGSFPANFMPVGEELWFTANSPNGPRALWKTDGTTTQRLIEFPNSGAEDIVYMNGAVYFFTSYNAGASTITELWKSDGTQDGTTSIIEVTRGESLVDGVDPYQMTVIGNTIFFAAQNEGQGTELWKSNGTAAGTQLVKDINPGTASSVPTALANIDGTLFFTANDGRTGRELWQSDGTTAGTRLVKDINAGNAEGLPASRLPLFTKIDNRLLFIATAEKEGTDVWISDGTTAGTTILKDINGGTRSTFNELNANFAVMNETLFFAASDSSGTGIELWQSDGTTASTRLLKDIHAGEPSSSPRDFTPFNDLLFFTAGVPDPLFSERNLWKTNGTPEGTEQVRDFSPLNFSNIEAQNLIVVQNKLFFKVDNGTNDTLWVSDGTFEGTVQITSVTNPRSIDYLTDVNGTLFFVNQESDTKHTLWKSDGTEAGTTLVKEILTDTDLPPYSQELVDVNGTLFFRAYSGNSLALWKSDGTPEGTQVVRSFDSDFGTMTASGGTLFFVAMTNTTTELWVSNGASENTIPIAEISTPIHSRATIVDVNGTLFFVTDEENGNCRLWKSDGTTDGTTIVKELNPTADAFCPRDMHPMPSGERAVFVAYDKETGVELWQTDGTAAGTRIVQDIARGPASSQPRNITITDDKIYFTADDGKTGQELWVIDDERLSAANTIFLPLIVH